MSRGGGGGKQPGIRYIQSDDGDLEAVGLEVYGKPGQGPRIWGANPQVAPTGKIPKGTKLVIPGEKPPLKLTGQGAHEVTCLIGGKSVRLMDLRITRTMDTGADAWQGRIAWNPGDDPELDRVTRPFGYERAAIYIGNELQVNGRLYGTEPQRDSHGITKTLTGYSFTADLIDSSVLPPLELSNVTLKQVANWYCRSIGINAVLEGDFGGVFKTVTADEGEKMFAHLAKLAAQRGGLVSCTPEGDLLFHRAKAHPTSVGTLEEGGSYVLSWRANYDGRKRWGAYKLVTSGVKGREKPIRRWSDIVPGAPVSSKRLPSSITEIDEDVPISRNLVFRADDTVPGAIKHACKWRRNKTFADSLTVPFQVSTWYAPNGKLWSVNTGVTVKSVALGVPSGFTFLIRQVDFELTAGERSATLHLLPPQAYSGKDLGKIWT